MNTKGISPLIATVLLLAFAVAIGTMVVSYVLDATKSTPCDDVAIGIEGSACYYASGNVQFILLNNGDTPITGIKARFLSSAGDIYEPKLANNLEPASASKIDIPYQTINPQGVSLTLIPTIQTDKELFCTEQELKTRLTQC